MSQVYSYHKLLGVECRIKPRLKLLKELVENLKAEAAHE